MTLIEVLRVLANFLQFHFSFFFVSDSVVRCRNSFKYITSSHTSHLLVMKVILFIGSAILAALVASQQCGTACPYGNNDCPLANCTRCNGPGGFGGVCVQGYPCFSNCKANTDCDQTSSCRECWLGKCSAGCGSPCNSSEYCRAPGCDACIAGQCQLWSCGNTCSTSADCKWGSCTSCIDGKCTAKCGAICLVDSDCDATPGCNNCTVGKCTNSTNTSNIVKF